MKMKMKMKMKVQINQNPKVLTLIGLKVRRATRRFLVVARPSGHSSPLAGGRTLESTHRESGSATPCAQGGAEARTRGGNGRVGLGEGQRSRA